MFMRSSVSLSFRLAAVCALGLALAGCDTKQRMADNDAEAKMRTADAARLAAADVDQLQNVANQYDSLAASISDLSPRMHILIRAHQAQVHFDVATLMLADLRSKEQGITRTINGIENLAVQVAGSQASVATLQAYDPSQQIDAIHAKEAVIQGSPGDVATGSGSSPTIAGVSALIDKLNDQISKATAQKQALDQSRQQALQQADDLTRKAEGETGDQQLQDTVSASNMRKSAGEADANIDAISNQIDRMQADLASASAQKTALDAAVAALEAQIQALQTGWASIQQQVDAQKTLQQQIIGTDAAAADTTESQTVTIAVLATQLSSMLTDAGTLRDSLNTQLDSAISNFSDAASSASQLRGVLLPKVTGLSPSPDAMIYQETLSTLNPTYFTLQKAAAMQDEASVAGSNAVIQTLLAQMFDGYQVVSGSQTVNVPGLKVILDKDKTGVDMPQSVASLPHPDPDSIKQMVTDANSKFSDALDTYNQRSGVDSGPAAIAQANLALLGRVATNHKWAQYATLLGDADGASQHLRDADSDDSQIDPAFRTAGQVAPKPPAPADSSGGTNGSAPSNNNTTTNNAPAGNDAP
jgi:hypothetical protein